MSAVVITSSIGRPELRVTLDSVRAQTMKVQHYVFVNGPPWHERAREILKDYPEVYAIYWPEETGECGVGPGYSGVFSAMPWLTNHDILLFLADDDFYEPEHVESLVTLIETHKLGWAYSLRNYIDKDGSFLCQDNWESLGAYPPVMDTTKTQNLVDNSCYAIRKEIARMLGEAWHVKIYGDRVACKTLMDAGIPFGSTGRYTVNYRIGGTFKYPAADYLGTDKWVRELYQNKFPWAHEQIFKPWGHEQNYKPEKSK